MEGTIRHRGSLLDEALQRALSRMKSDERKTPMAPRPFQLTQGCGIVDCVIATRKASRQEEERRGALTKISICCNAEPMSHRMNRYFFRVSHSMMFPLKKECRQQEDKRRELVEDTMRKRRELIASQLQHKTIDVLSGRGGSMFPEEIRILEKERRREIMEEMFPYKIRVCTSERGVLSGRGGSITFPEKIRIWEKERRREIMKEMFPYKTRVCTSERGVLSERGGSMMFPEEIRIWEKERRREIMKEMFPYKTRVCTSERGVLSETGGSMMFPEEIRILEKERRREIMEEMFPYKIRVCTSERAIVDVFTVVHTACLEKLGKDTTRDEFRLNYPAINRSKDVQAMQAHSRIMSEIKAEFHNLKKLEIGNWKLEELRTPYVVSWWKGNKETLIKYFGRHSMETENEEDGQNPEIRNAVISDKAGPTELEMFTAERYRQSEQLRLKNDKQMMEIEEALQRILHHLQMQTKGEKRRRCHASA